MLDNLIKDELYEVEEMQGELFMGETEEDQKERFKITDIDSANWAFRKLRAITEKENEIKRLMNKEIQRIKDWGESELKTLKNSTGFFEGLLTEYYVVEKEKDPKFRISTPYGKVSSRKQQPKWNYEDDKVLEWLKENDAELIRIKEEINKTELKEKYNSINGQVVTEDGEIVEGVTVEERPDTITIKVVE